MPIIHCMQTIILSRKILLLKLCFWSDQISSQFVLTPNENLKSVGARLCYVALVRWFFRTLPEEGIAWSKRMSILFKKKKRMSMICLVIHGPKKTGVPM